MIDGTKQLAGGIEVWAYRRGFLGRERIVRAALAVGLFWLSRENLVLPASADV